MAHAKPIRVLNAKTSKRKAAFNCMDNFLFINWRKTNANFGKLPTFET